MKWLLALLAGAAAEEAVEDADILFTVFRREGSEGFDYHVGLIYTEDNFPHWNAALPMRLLMVQGQESQRTIMHHPTDITTNLRVNTLAWQNCPTIPKDIGLTTPEALAVVYDWTNMEGCQYLAVGWFQENYARLQSCWKKKPEPEQCSSAWLMKLGATRLWPEETGTTTEHFSPAVFKEEANLPVLPQRMIMLSGNHRLMYMDIDTKEEYTIHQGRGCYYGVIAGDPDPYVGPTVWVVSRPFYWRQSRAGEWLMNIAVDGSGIVLSEVEVPTRFGHDVARFGQRVFVLSTESGEVIEMYLHQNPQVMTLTKIHSIFTKQQHVNSLSILPQGTGGQMWFMLHGHRSGSLTLLLDLDEPKPARARIKDVPCVPIEGYVKGSAEDVECEKTYNASDVRRCACGQQKDKKEYNAWAIRKSAHDLWRQETEKHRNATDHYWLAQHHGFGSGAHGLVRVEDEDDSILCLDSRRGTVRRLHYCGGECPEGRNDYVWYYGQNLTFAKGIMVVGDEKDHDIYIGISPHIGRRERDDPCHKGELLSVNSVKNDTNFRVNVMPGGLLNIISMPHLHWSAHTVRQPDYIPRQKLGYEDGKWLKRLKSNLTSYQNSHFDINMFNCTPQVHANFGQKTIDYWEKRHLTNIEDQPARLNMTVMLNTTRYFQKENTVWKCPKTLEFGKIDGTPVYDHFMKHNDWWEKAVQAQKHVGWPPRECLYDRCIPLIISSVFTEDFLSLPFWYQTLKKMLLPEIKKVMKVDDSKINFEKQITRAELLKFDPGDTAKHEENKRVPTHLGHRIMVNVVCGPGMRVSYFDMQKQEDVNLDTTQGAVYEVNNNFKISYNNTSDEPCIIMAFDWSLREFDQVEIPVGSRCKRNGKNNMGMYCEVGNEAEKKVVVNTNEQHEKKEFDPKWDDAKEFKEMVIAATERKRREDDPDLAKIVDSVLTDKDRQKATLDAQRRAAASQRGRAPPGKAPPGYGKQYGKQQMRRAPPNGQRQAMPAKTPVNRAAAP